MKPKSLLTADRLRELLHYDPATGLFTWRRNRQRVKAGDVAGHLEKDRSYIFIVIDGATHRAHRLAWLYMTGEYVTEVDHEDLDRSNNRWSNLRDATRSQNRANMTRQRNNTTGFKGVYYDKRNKLRPFLAYIKSGKKRRELGYFSTAEEAHQAYCRAAQETYGEFARA